MGSQRLFLLTAWLLVSSDRRNEVVCVRLPITKREPDDAAFYCGACL